jgi:hypothetical protein
MRRSRQPLAPHAHAEQLTVQRRVGGMQRRLLFRAERDVTTPQADRALRNAQPLGDLAERHALLATQAPRLGSFERLHEHMFA